jgi:hypothetical protein
MLLSQHLNGCSFGLAPARKEHHGREWWLNVMFAEIKVGFTV